MAKRPRCLQAAPICSGALKDAIHDNPPELVIGLKPVTALRYVQATPAGVLDRRARHAYRYCETSGDPRDLSAPGRSRGQRGLAAAAQHGDRRQYRQEPRCWYYRAPDDAFDCARKGGRYCNAFTGDSRYHSIAGSMKVATRPCTAACPGAVEIPEYMELIRAGDVDGAARRLLARNPLPAVTGRVCPHTCEDDCNRGLFDDAVSVRDVERCLGDRVLDHPGFAAPRRRRRAPSRSWARARPVLRPRTTCGCAVTSSPCSNGAPRSRRHAALRDPGVPAAAECWTAASPCSRRWGSSSVPAVARRDAARRRICAPTTIASCVATGALGAPAHRARGRGGARRRPQFLKHVAEGERRVPGPQVLVIGGGSVAMDVAVSARRLGAEQVTVACLETCDEMPALLEEVEEALAEGIELAPSCGPARLLRHDDVSLAGMELVRCTSVFDEQAALRRPSTRAIARRSPPTR